MEKLPAKKELTKVEILQNELATDEINNQLKNVLQDNAPAFITSLVDIYSGDEKLRECEPRLVIAEAMKAASLDLPITKGLGFAYVIGYNKKPQFQIGYKGYLQLAMRTGQYMVINVDAVYEGELTRKDKLTGWIELNGDRVSDTVVGYFAYIEMKNGFKKMLYMSVEQIKAHAKKYSSSYGQSYSPWTNDFDGMSKKTVLKNLLSHYGFLSVKMQTVMSQDNEDNTAIVAAKIEKATKQDNTETIAFEDVTTKTVVKNQSVTPEEKKDKKPLPF